MPHQPTSTLVVIGDSPFDTTNVEPNDISILGELHSHTRSDRVADLDRDSPPTGGALPITHTSPAAAPRLMASVTGEHQPEALSFTATNRTATAAVAVMTAVVVALAVVAALAVGGRPVNWLTVAAILGAGFVVLAGLSVIPLLRWVTRMVDAADGRIDGADR